MIPLTSASTEFIATVLTLSFRGDFELCSLLCETVDACIPRTYPHIVVVPKADLKLFAPLGDTRRQIVSEAEFIPSWLHRLPLPNQRIRKILHLPHREIYLTTRGDIVRGWIAQQMMKLSAASQVGAPIIIHVDSDVAFLRPLRREHIIRDGKVRLLRIPGAANTAMHRLWHAAAAKLLGIPPKSYFGADFVGNLVVWQSAHAKSMMAHITEVHGRDALIVLSKTRAFSEYILYGIYCDEVLGLEKSGHFTTEIPLCETVWTDPEPDKLEARLSKTKLGPDQIAIGIQSTLPISIASRRKVLAAMV